MDRGVRSAKYDAGQGVYSFLIQAPTPPDAFTIVGELFRPVFGDEWWAKVSAVPIGE
jgi:hypothetical protein